MSAHENRHFVQRQRACKRRRKKKKGGFKLFKNAFLIFFFFLLRDFHLTFREPEYPLNLHCNQSRLGLGSFCHVLALHLKYEKKKKKSKINEASGRGFF